MHIQRWRSNFSLGEHIVNLSPVMGLVIKKVAADGQAVFVSQDGVNGSRAHVSVAV